MRILNLTVKGKIHSIESMGTVDGPNIRFVVFFQGCPLRCLYCHNPDTWETRAGELLTADEIYKKYESVKEFTKGGITATGGEPLLQLDFLIELFKLFKKNNVHTCLDTSGFLFDNSDKYFELIKYTDLVLLDLKAIDPNLHKKLTGADNKNILNFAKFLSDNNIPIWVRNVVAVGLTDNESDLKALGRFMAKLKNVQALDILPYHNMAIKKYEEMNLDYKLKNVQPTTKEEAIKARDIILEEYRTAKNSI